MLCFWEALCAKPMPGARIDGALRVGWPGWDHSLLLLLLYSPRRFYSSLFSTAAMQLKLTVDRDDQLSTLSKSFSANNFENR